MISLSKVAFIALALMGSAEATKPVVVVVNNNQNSNNNNQADTCLNQNGCMDISVTKVTGVSSCAGSTCSYKVCVTVNNSKPGCVKSGAWSHTCRKSADNNECETATGFGDRFGLPVSTNTASPDTGYMECQIVKAGEKAQFLFKDGRDCSGGPPLQLPNNGPSCEPRTAAVTSCSGNGLGKECVWTIPTPNDCTGGGGGGGDPHFRTYDGTLYSYHGECDLIMTNSPTFDNGLGLDVHSRTKLISGLWSLISNAAIRIGSDILEINNHGIAFINHKEISTFPIEMANKYTVTKEIQIVEQATNEWNETFSDASEKEELVQYTIDLSKRSDPFPFNPELQNQIIISIYRTMISVRVDAHLEDGAGMLGNHVTFGLVGRDLQTVYTTSNEMGAAWQVTDKDPLLFNDVGSVVYPEQCMVPESTSRRLRAVPNEDLKRAQTVCSKLSSDLYAFCVEDVLRTGDFQIANGYSF